MTNSDKIQKTLMSIIAEHLHHVSIELVEATDANIRAQLLLAKSQALSALSALIVGQKENYAVGGSDEPELVSKELLESLIPDHMRKDSPTELSSKFR